METIRSRTTVDQPICRFEFRPRRSVVFKAAYSRTHNAIHPIKKNGAIDYSKKYSSPRSFAKSTGEQAGSIKRTMFVEGVNLIDIEAVAKGGLIHTSSTLILQGYSHNYSACITPPSRADSSVHPVSAAPPPPAQPSSLRIATLDIESLPATASEMKVAIAKHQLLHAETTHDCFTAITSRCRARLLAARNRVTAARKALAEAISAEADCEADFNEARTMLDDCFEASEAAEDDLHLLQDELGL